jgi:hypothetical protein
VIQDYQLKEILLPVERTLEQDISVINQQEKIVVQRDIGLAINGEQERRLKARSNETTS